MSYRSKSASPNIDSILHETRSFPPPPEFSKNAHIRSEEDYDRLCAQAAADPEAFWADIARELHWFKPWDKVLEWNVAVGEVVCRRQDQPLLQLPRPARRNLAQEQGRHHLGERARRSAHAHLSAVAERSAASSPTF